MEGNWSRYRDRVARVIDYIHANPAAQLDNNTLADVAHLSPYHWHRVYRAITGETAVATVRRCRLHRAAGELVRTEHSIAEIGASVGYPELPSFTRAFKSFYGVAPGQFRLLQQTPEPLVAVAASGSSGTGSVEIVERPATRVIGLPHRGDYRQIGATFDRVLAACSVAGITGVAANAVGVYFSDPHSLLNEDELKSFAGVAVAAEVDLPPALSSWSVAGGRYALFTHIGPYPALEQSYMWLYSHWLAESGCSLRDVPCCELYLNSPLETPPAELVTAICMPIE